MHMGEATHILDGPVAPYGISNFSIIVYQILELPLQIY